MSNTSIDRGSRNRVEVWISGATVIVLGILCLLILRPFISAMLWALILCFTTWPLFLVILGVFGGAIAFGVIGMFLGPTLLALGYNLLE